MKKNRLFNQQKKLSLLNQLLYKRRKIQLKKLRLLQEQKQQNIYITINNDFENNRRIKELFNRVEMVVRDTTPLNETLQRGLEQIINRQTQQRRREPQTQVEEPQTRTERDMVILQPRRTETTPIVRNWVRHPNENKRMMVSAVGGLGKQRIREDRQNDITTNRIQSQERPEYV